MGPERLEFQKLGLSNPRLLSSSVGVIDRCLHNDTEVPREFPRVVTCGTAYLVASNVPVLMEVLPCTAPGRYFRCRAPSHPDVLDLYKRPLQNPKTAVYNYMFLGFQLLIIPTASDAITPRGKVVNG